MGREVVIEQTVVDYAESQNVMTRKVIYAGRRGSPDRWFFVNGYVFCIEFKKPGEKPDAQQAREHARLRERGTPVYVIDNIFEGKAIIDAYLALPVRAMPRLRRPSTDAA